MKHYTSRLRDHSRQLRVNQTDAEKKLWQLLRGRQFDGFKFRRQHPIAGYIADFICLDKKLIVELDGGQHAERIDYDQTRDKKLAAAGFRVLRIWNNQMLAETEAVAEMIYRELTAPHPGPLPASGAREKIATASTLSPDTGRGQGRGEGFGQPAARSPSGVPVQRDTRTAGEGRDNSKKERKLT